MKEEITSYGELREMARKFELLENTGILDTLKEILNDIPTALIECSCLQQLVIDSMDDVNLDSGNLPHIKFALTRLVNITNSVYYNQKELKKTLE